MSRNHKDKYENSNPRRTHTFMSTEDANSGKKSYWPELEITGSIRNLSPNLWQLTHLTALYLNDNSLQRIPAEIGRMANLRALDLSSNKLRSLPAELGDLIYLRELLLNQNYLRVLPYELGKLFQLKVLGLQGNPLSKEVMALYGEPSGTSKLLSYMLDNLQDSHVPRTHKDLQSSCRESLNSERGRRSEISYLRQILTRALRVRFANMGEKRARVFPFVADSFVAHRTPRGRARL
ncbi:CCR4-NOT transcription complex subunit 6-like isoform X4 [Lasioglossum baleicum]|uniref:CCR4-NOT transcription complex subunit 6-like isoform X4 n=1 Tax=Lasioglossum baleicum TaxID=434251 RepID=UPI003FCC669B